MAGFILRRIVQFRQNYWFWPSAMTLAAVLAGFLLPAIDARIGSDWVRDLGVLRPIQVDGARAILTTLAGATLGVAGVAFSVTIVAVSFATANYGPRLIGNFMGDRTNQVVLGIFVATFVYCITVLSTVHAQLEVEGTTHAAFVPQLSLHVALALTLTAVGALIVYIHHIPESINIMNLAAQIGERLRQQVTALLDAEEGRARRDADAGRARRDGDDGRARRDGEGGGDQNGNANGGGGDAVDVEPWLADPPDDGRCRVTARAAGFLQQIDLDSLSAIAGDCGLQIVLHHGPGDFLAPGDVVMSLRPGPGRTEAAGGTVDPAAVARRMRGCFTQGSNRTGVQDVLFLSDQLVDVLGRALSPGVNDPHTAMLCLDWLRPGLAAFLGRPPPQPAAPGDPVLYRRVTFEAMLDRSFDRMRQYVAADRTVTLHALALLGQLGRAATRPAAAAACARQMRRLATSAREMLPETGARDEVGAALARALSRLPDTPGGPG